MVELIGRLLLSVVCVEAIAWGATMIRGGQALGVLPLMLGALGVIMAFMEGYFDHR